MALFARYSGIKAPRAEDAPQEGLLPPMEQPQGLLGRVQAFRIDPRTAAGLQQAGQALMGSAAWSTMPTTGAQNFAQGVSGYGAGVQGYDQAQAKLAADAINEHIKAAQLAKAEREASGISGPVNKQFGASVITEQDGVKGFSIPVQDPVTGDIHAQFVPIGKTMLSRTTGLTPDEQAALDIATAGGKTKAQVDAENPAANETAAAKAKVAAATAAADANARADAERGQAGKDVITGADTTTAVLDRIESLIPKSSQSAITGGLRNYAASAGITDSSRLTDKRLELLGTELLAEQVKTKMLGANPTEGERAVYEELAGKLSKPGPMAEKMAVIEELRGRLERSLKRAQKSQPTNAPEKKVRTWNPATGRVE